MEVDLDMGVRVTVIVTRRGTPAFTRGHPSSWEPADPAEYDLRLALLTSDGDALDLGPLSDEAIAWLEAQPEVAGLLDGVDDDDDGRDW